jgi:GPH family glycoside/pentoside/hexuronide:cation symporter
MPTPIFGVCFAPYIYPYNNPNPVPERVVADLMDTMVAQQFTHIRTYSCQNGDQYNVKLAAARGLKVALGVWVAPGKTADNHAAIKEAVSQAKQHGNVIHMVIGNEVNRDDVFKPPFQPPEITDLIKWAIDLGGPVPVTSCFSGTVLSQQPEWETTVDACQEVVYLTVYPWYGDAPPNDIKTQMNWSWDNGLKQVRDKGKKIVIAEIGWPSYGGRATSPENEGINFWTTKKFLLGGTNPHFALDAYWFEMFDEAWKSGKPWERHWGTFTADAAREPPVPVVKTKFTPPPTGR